VKDENGYGLLSVVCFLLLLYLLEHKKTGRQNHKKQLKQNQKVSKNSHDKKILNVLEAEYKTVMTKIEMYSKK
jgi:hypothetical protein